MIKKILVLLAMMSAFALPAQAMDEGFEYNKVSPALPTANPKKIEVIELFWYGCPHCYSFEPTLNKWLDKKPDNVEFVRIPAVFRKSWVPHARAYYTAEALGVLEKTHTAFFTQVHAKKRRLQTKKDIRKFFIENGVNGEDFDSAWGSFVVESKTKRAVTLTRRYGIKGVPALVVNGKYRTSATEASINNPGGPTNDDVIKVVNFLVAQETDLTKAAAKSSKK